LAKCNLNNLAGLSLIAVVEQVENLLCNHNNETLIIVLLIKLILIIVCSPNEVNLETFVDEDKKLYREEPQRMKSTLFWNKIRLKELSIIFESFRGASISWFIYDSGYMVESLQDSLISIIFESQVAVDNQLLGKCRDVSSNENVGSDY
jgi:hypothetical protein